MLYSTPQLSLLIVSLEGLKLKVEMQQSYGVGQEMVVILVCVKYHFL